MADFNATYYSGSDLYGAIPSPVLATYFAPSTVNVVTVANVRYFQRVLDNGATPSPLWCYYATLNVLDPAPASGATSPPWVGPISDPQVVAAVPVP